MKSYVVPLSIALCCLLLQGGEVESGTPAPTEDGSVAGESTILPSTAAFISSTAEPTTGGDTTNSATTAAPTEASTGKPLTDVSQVTSDSSADVSTAATGATTEKTSTDVPQVTTVNSSETTTVAPDAGCSGHRFDAASFIGGIVLAAGLAGIAFLACKFYASRSETNYHQF